MNYLDIVLTIVGIISPFILATVWMTTLITRTSNRALLLEIKSTDYEERIKKLELSTSYETVEKTVEKICRQVFNNKDFKVLMKEAIKETMLHIDKNRTHEEVGKIDLVLDEVRRLHADIVNSHRN